MLVIEGDQESTEIQMLEAFIIDQLEKAEEQQWEPIFPTLELPLYDEDEVPLKKEEKSVLIMDFN
jgi:hypothetical protein